MKYVPTSLVLLLLASFAIAGCRSGHFEHRSISDSETAFQLQLRQDSQSESCSAAADSFLNETACRRVKLAFEVKDPQGNSIRRHEFQVILEHESLRSTRVQKVSTNEDGVLHLEPEFSVPAFLPESLFRVAAKFSSETLGRNSMALDLVPMRETRSVLMASVVKDTDLKASTQLQTRHLELRPLFARRQASPRPVDKLHEDWEVVLGFQLTDPQSPLPPIPLPITTELEIGGAKVTGVATRDPQGFFEIPVHIFYNAYTDEQRISIAYRFTLGPKKYRLVADGAMQIQLESDSSQALVSFQSVAPSTTTETLSTQLQEMDLKYCEIRQISKTPDILLDKSLNLLFRDRFELLLSPRLLRQRLDMNPTRSQEWKALRGFSFSGQIGFLDPKMPPEKSVFRLLELNKQPSSWEDGNLRLLFEPTWSDLRTRRTEFDIVVSLESPDIEVAQKISRRCHSDNSASEVINPAEADSLLRPQLINESTSHNFPNSKIESFFSKAVDLKIAQAEATEDERLRILNILNEGATVQQNWELIRWIFSKKAKLARLDVKRIDFISSISSLQPKQRRLNVAIANAFPDSNLSITEYGIPFEADVTRCYLFHPTSTPIMKDFYYCLDTAIHISIARPKKQSNGIAYTPGIFRPMNFESMNR